jgi:hypothetical protein
VAAGRGGELGRQGAALDHAGHVGPGSRIGRQLALLVHAAKEGSLRLVSDAGGPDVDIYVPKLISPTFRNVASGAGPSCSAHQT